MNVLESSLNRVVAVLTVVVSLGGALLPVLANLDLESTAGVIAGVVALVTTSTTWLIGWQKSEAAERQAAQFDKVQATYNVRPLDPIPPDPDAFH